MNRHRIRLCSFVPALRQLRPTPPQAAWRPASNSGLHSPWQGNARVAFHGRFLGHLYLCFPIDFVSISWGLWGSPGRLLGVSWGLLAFSSGLLGSVQSPGVSRRPQEPPRRPRAYPRRPPGHLQETPGDLRQLRPTPPQISFRFTFRPWILQPGTYKK